MATKLTAKEKQRLAVAEDRAAKAVKRAADNAAVLLPAPTKAQRAVAEKCLARIEEDARTMTSAFYDLAVHIYEAYEGKYAQLCGYDNFEAYAEKNLPFGYRQAMNFKECGAMIIKLGIPKERVEKVGMTKFKELLPSFAEAAELPESRAEQVVQQLLDKGEKKSVRELQAEFQRQRAVPATPERFILRNLAFDTHQGSIVADALKVAYAEIGSENNVDAVTHICDEWLAFKGEGGLTSTLEDYIALIERKFNVKLVVEHKQSAAKAAAKSKPAGKTAAAESKAVTKKEEGDDVREEETVEIDLDEMSKKEMLALIKKHGISIKNPQDMSETKLREALAEALSEDIDEEDEDALLQELGNLE